MACASCIAASAADTGSCCAAATADSKDKDKMHISTKDGLVVWVDAESYNISRNRAETSAGKLRMLAAAECFHGCEPSCCAMVTCRCSVSAA
jgi:hypothetical protein